MILVVHSAQKFNLPDWGTIIPRFCQMGCQWFFVLSSFTLCNSYDKKKPKYFSFIKARISRIWLPYVCAMLLTVTLSVLSIIVTDINVLGSSINPIDIIINILLLNGLVPTTANNLVLRGGWFVGTIMLFYIIFPIMFQFNAYCKKRFKNWTFVFPLLVALICIAINICIGTFVSKSWLGNNSFGYFFIVNQIPALVFGFTLYDVSSNRKSCSAYTAIIKAILILSCSLVLFTLKLPYVFVILPALCGWGFYNVTLAMLDFEMMPKKEPHKKCWLSFFGKQSFNIYLTHSFVVYEGSIVARKLLSSLPVSDVLLYVILLPILVALSYMVAWMFQYTVSSIRKGIEICKKTIFER